MSAGLLELSIGASIGAWVGNKQDTTRLGLATIILSSAALAAAVAVRRFPARAWRWPILLGILVPALICFTTVGRLWLVPGPLLLVGAALLFIASPRGDLVYAIDQRRWRIMLVSLCGAYYVFLGATALGVAGVLGILGGCLIWTAMACASRSRTGARALLVLATVPFAAATWWTVVTPVIAVLVLVLGTNAIRRTRRAPVAQRSGHWRPAPEA